MSTGPTESAPYGTSFWDAPSVEVTARAQHVGLFSPDDCPAQQWTDAERVELDRALAELHG